MRLEYLIDGRKVAFAGGNEADYFTGKGGCLSREFDDLALGRPWYDRGYAILPSDRFFDAARIRADVTRVVRRIVQELDPSADLVDFTLETYHRFVEPDLHGEVIARSRRLYPPDFGFDEAHVVNALGHYFGEPLGYRRSEAAAPQWIIVRINPPHSKGFNPAHKDIYEPYDADGRIPRMINVWIPVCGVGDGTGLPVAPGSHLVPESEIVRTRAGSILEGQRYSVNSVRSWGGENSLQTLCPAPDEMLVFSSHLIHGLGRNLSRETTRVSLEFRLFVQPEAEQDTGPAR